MNFVRIYEIRQNGQIFIAHTEIYFHFTSYLHSTIKNGHIYA